MFMHFIGDFALQTEYLAMNKGKHWYLLLSHVMIWTACVCVPLYWFNNFAMWKVVFLISGHFICDWWKCRQKPENKYLYIDQAIHFLQLVIVF